MDIYDFVYRIMIGISLDSGKKFFKLEDEIMKHFGDLKKIISKYAEAENVYQYKPGWIREFKSSIHTINKSVDFFDFFIIITCKESNDIIFIVKSV